jgi:uncharacterized protein CbrC (UPF0167 family)
MRTKALLSVAAIAASAITAMAQSNVYSLNIVGYATVTINPGYNLLANPLSAGATNGANEIMPIQDGQVILTWTGTKYNQVGYDSGFGGWVGADGSTAANPPSLPPGQGFFYFNPLTAATNVTFVGQVVPGPSSTNTLTLTPGYNLVGSPLPATLTTAQGGITNAPLSLPVLDGMVILQWTGTKYQQTGFDSGFGGWVGADGSTASTVPGYQIGQGFFIFNPQTTSAAWKQSLP